MAHKGLAKDLQKFRNMGCVLADPNVQTNTQIFLLIESDCYYEVVHPSYKTEGTLFMLPTICGYALSDTHTNKKKTPKWR